MRLPAGISIIKGGVRYPLMVLFMIAVTPTSSSVVSSVHSLSPLNVPIVDNLSISDTPSCDINDGVRKRFDTKISKNGST